MSDLLLADAQQIAESIVGAVRWNGAEGYCECPGIGRHTNANAPSDCKVVVETLASGVKPGVYCFHGSCSTETNAASYGLRSALGKRTVDRLPKRKRTAPPPPKQKPTFDPAVLARIAARCPGINEGWLAARSRKQVSNRTPASFLHDLYLDGERVVVFTAQRSQGQAVWTRQGPPFDARALDTFRTGAPEGVWFLAQPVNGERLENDNGKLSRRSWQNVTSWRYAVIESDEADPALWLAALVQMPLRIAALYTSGGRSIHALVRLDAGSKREWDERIEAMEPALVTMGADPGALTAVRLTRLPGCERVEKGAVQKLLYLHPDPPEMPLWEMEVYP